MMRNDWSEQGFLLCRNLIPADRIERLLSEYRATVLNADDVLARQPRFRRESGDSSHPHAYDAPNRLTEFGYLAEGLKNPHVLENYPGFSGLALSILCSREVQDRLADLNPDHAEYCLHQSMFFDFNPGTEPHQDSYYIDSEPRGAMIGFWLALEDIHADAGRFYVVADSHVEGPGLELFDADNAAYLNALERTMGGLEAKRFVPDLAAGDALIWHGDVIHGALPNVDPSRSRKSLTGHYIPTKLLGRNRFRVYGNTVERTCLGMRYVVTNRPEVESNRPVAIRRNTVEVAGESVEFLAVRTAGGEQAAFSLPPGTRLEDAAEPVT
jgi:phytanoyl-CoA hydroxylase